MKHLKSYRKIKKACNKYGIENWSIGKDGLVDVDSNVSLRLKNLEKLPLNFGKVSGSFHCDDNELTSLEGAPKEVGRDFYCDGNKLTSLEGASKEVGGGFYCFNNKLTNLEGAPEKIGFNFHCGYNELTSLEGSPREVISNFYCYKNKLITLEGIPFDIKYLDCWSNPINDIWKFIGDEKYLQEFIEVYDVVRPGKVVILEYLNDIKKLMGKEPVKREEIPSDWEILDI